MPCGPLHLYLANLCGDGRPIIEVDNAAGHAPTIPEPDAPVLNMRKSSSTGSLGVNKKGASRWDTGSSPMGAPKLLEPESDELERLIATTAMGVLSAAGTAPGLARASSGCSHSSLDDSSSSCRWNSSCVNKNDGAVKLPRRKMTLREEFRDDSNSSLSDLLFCIDDVDKDVSPLFAKHSSSLENIKAELFRVQ